MSYGMTYEQFWFGEPIIAKYFRKANELNIKRKNQEMHMQGRYVFDAISIALSNVHLDGKQHKFNQYTEKPYDIFPKTKKELEREAIAERNKLINYLNGLSKSWDKKE